jgi:FkbM family methyltransferase
MKKTYSGPLAWFKRWNFKRVERRRWLRDLFEAIPATDAAMLEALTFLVEKTNAEAAAREVWQAEVERRLAGLADQVARRVGERLEEPLAALKGDGFPVLPTARPGLVREAELDLVTGLAPWLSPRLALDIGAHHGPFSEALLDAGFEVHALEPNPETCGVLAVRLGGRPGFTAHQLAAGSSDGEADLGLVRDPTGHYIDPSQFSSLAGLAPPPGLVATGSVRVKVRRLDTLVRDLGIAPPSFIKVDAEGTDLEVMRGMGTLRPAMLQVEFWDEAMPFSSSGATNQVANLVAQARLQGLPWHLVVFRRWGDDRAAFYSGRSGSPERSWGNVIFFAEQAMYEKARQILAAALPEARFVAKPKA